MNTSSEIDTASPQTDTPSIRTHFPIREFQPMIDSEIQLFAFISQLCIRTQFFNRTPTIVICLPSFTLQFGPITTFGPIKALSSISADFSINTFPIMFFPFDSRVGHF